MKIARIPRLTATAIAVAFALSSASALAADAQAAGAAPNPPAAQQPAETPPPATTATTAAKPAQSDKQAQANAKAQQITDRETIAAFDGWQNRDMARVAVHGGRALLRQMETAHADLANKNIGDAKNALTAANDFAEGLQLMVPFTVVKDNIRNAQHKLLSSSTGVIVNDMLPVYANVDEMAEFSPQLASKAKTQLHEAGKKIANSKQQAPEKMQEVAADFETSTIYLPVMYIEHQVQAAQKALKADPQNIQTAQTAVEKALDSLVDATVNMHISPQLQANQGKQNS